MKKRFFRAVVCWAAALVILLLYALICTETGVGIPCLFYLITGWQCPGCGISRACLALLHLDFRGALQHHALIFVILIYAGWTLSDATIRYIRHGVWLPQLRPVVLNLCFLILFVGYGILRNIL